jgi:hypothetical protein
VLIFFAPPVIPCLGAVVCSGSILFPAILKMVMLPTLLAGTSLKPEKERILCGQRRLTRGNSLDSLNKNTFKIKLS